MAAAPGLEKAVFTDAKPRDLRRRWLLLLGILSFLGFSYWAFRDVAYGRLVHDSAQRLFNELSSSSIEKLGSVEVDRQGDVTLRDAEAWTRHEGNHQLFFRARAVRLALDGIPLRDPDLRIMRVDLFEPEIFIRREAHGEWNVEWAFLAAPGLPEAAPDPRDERWKDYRTPDRGFPRNGVHVHGGIVNVTFASRSGREVTWRATGVAAVIRKVDGVLRLHPFEGDFYGGRIKADCSVPRTSPFTVSQFTVDVRDADIARMAENSRYSDRPVSGKFNAVTALTVDPERTKQRPIAAGRAEISEGNLWEFPAFAGVINLLTLAPVTQRRIDSAVLEFTVEEDQIRISTMQFLGYPVSLFGDGACSLTGDWMEVVFIPRLGKSDWNSILPIIGAPLDLLGNVVKGLLVPVVLTGSFDEPQWGVDTGRPLKPSTRKLAEERSPK